MDYNPLRPFVEKLASRVELTSADTEALLKMRFSTREMRPGSYFVRERQRPTASSLLIAGVAMRSKLTSEGARQIVGLHLPGDSLDLQQLYLDEADHNIQALTTITLIEVARGDLQSVADKHPNVLKAITIDNVIEASIEREWLLNVGRRIGRARLAHFLCEFAVRLAIKSHVPDQTAIALPLTQEQIGDAVALTPVHVNRMLKELEAEGLITRTKNSIVIVEWKAMASAADFNPSYLHLNQKKQRATA